MFDNGLGSCLKTFSNLQNDDVDDIDSIIQEVNAITGDAGVQVRIEKATGMFILPPGHCMVLSFMLSDRRKHYTQSRFSCVL